MQINRRVSGEPLLYINTDNRETAGVMAVSALEPGGRGKDKAQAGVQIARVT